MRVTRYFDIFLGLFLLLFRLSLAQRGYNYVRPGINSNTAGSGNVGNLPPNTLTNPLRTIVTAIPTGTGATGPGFPTAPTAFGAPSSVPVTTAFGAFTGQSQRGSIGIPSTAPSTGIGSTFSAVGSSGLPSRSAVTQRPTGVFGASAARGQSPQFTSGTPTGTGSGADVDYDSGGDYSAIPGIPGVDYPIYSQVPQTNFDCAQQALPGYYADVEAQCQVFHICALNRTYSFLCPNGTVFSQETLVCVWWNQYDCSSAPALYANNAFIYDYGNEGSATNIGNYQGNAGQTSRSQNNFQIATNAARTTAAGQTANIFGSSVGIRPTVTSGAYGGITTPLTPAPAATYTGGNIGSQTNRSRFQQTGTLPSAAAQSFPDTSTGITTTQIGNANRGAGNAGIVAQQSTLPTAQLSTSSTNREYLPPARRP